MAKQENPGNVNPIQIQKYLKGVDYPVSKTDLIARAKENHAPQEVIAKLESLDVTTFTKPTDVTKAVGETK